MSRRQQLLLLVVYFTLSAIYTVRGEQPAPEAKPKQAAAKRVPLTDLFGDPLPDGCWLALGQST